MIRSYATMVVSICLGWLKVEDWMKKIHINLFRIIRVLEMLISVTIIIAIGISMVTLVFGLFGLYQDPLRKDAFQSFLGTAFNILIGIEFLKMIFHNNLDTVVEVILFAIARQMIVEHTTVIENCVGVISIAILFVIRKYLFIPELDNNDDNPHDRTHSIHKNTPEMHVTSQSENVNSTEIEL